jgi:hypothetical protein
MMTEVEIEPDPSRPLGGYARVVLPAGSLSEAEVSVSVYELFKERFLGIDGWQPTEAAFGPYPVESTSTQQHFVIGPEIVNHLSEFVPVRFAFGGFTSEVTWPDTVATAPNAPPLGQVIGEKPAAAAGGPLEPVADTERQDAAPASSQPPEGQPAQSPEIRPTRPEPASVKPTLPPGRGEDGKTGVSWVALLLGAVLIAALAIGAYFYWISLEPAPLVEIAPVTEEEPEPDPVEETVTETEEPVAEPEIDPCAAETLRGSDEGFAMRLESLRGCAGAASAETALSILEAGVDAGDAEALLLFGHLYNPNVTDSDIEGAMGLSFSDNFEVAIDYYSRARDAGLDAAADALTQACEGLRTIDPSAAEDLCE